MEQVERFETLLAAKVAADREAAEQDVLISELGHAILSAEENVRDLGYDEVTAPSLFVKEALMQVNGWLANGRSW